MSTEVQFQDLVTINQTNFDLLVKKIESQAKIRLDKGEVKRLLSDILEYFKYFNTLDEFSYNVFDNHTPLDQVMIPSELAAFIIPAAVRLDASSLKYVDLLVRESFIDKDKSQFNLAEYNTKCSRFRSLFKKDFNDNVVSLSQLKSVMNLSDVLSKLANATDDAIRVNYGDQPFVPIVLRHVEGLFEPYYFNSTVDEIVKDYIARLSFV